MPTATAAPAPAPATRARRSTAEPAEPTDLEGLPINELEQVLESFPDDVRAIFGPALTVFAGPFASETDPAEKLRQLENLIQKVGTPLEGLQ